MNALSLAVVLHAAIMSNNSTLTQHTAFSTEARSAIEGLQTLAFEVELKEDSPSFVHRPAVKRTILIEVFMKDGAKFRVEAFDSEKNRLVLIVSDGQSIKQWSSGENLWTETQLPALDESYTFTDLLVKDSLISRYATSWIDDNSPFGAWLEHLIAAKEVELLSDQEAEGKTCNMIYLERKELAFPGYYKEDHSLYLDAATHLPVKELRHVHAWTIIGSKKGTQEYTYRRMQPDVELRADAFDFTPPPGSKFIAADSGRFQRAVPAGKPAPDLEVSRLDGETVRLEQFKGKHPVLMAFWATWCVPCIQEMPVLEKLHREYSADGLIVLGVSTDSHVWAVKRFIEKHPVTYLIAHDNNELSDKRYYVKSIPHTVLIAKNGMVVRTWQGWHGASEEQAIREELGKLGLSPSNLYDNSQPSSDAAEDE